VARDFFGSDPEIDQLGEAAVSAIAQLGAEIVEVRFDPSFFDLYVRNALQTLTPVLMYGFRDAFEDYLAQLGPDVPKTVESWLRIYETELRNSPFPPEESRPSQALPVLRAAVAHSAAESEYRQMVEHTLPMLTREKRALFERHGIDALVMPYQPMFAEPIVTPLESHSDPSFVRAAPGSVAPNTIGGYSSEGFPMIVVPMGFGTRGLPMGLAIMGRPYEDGEILGYAYAFEQATMHRRSPSSAPPLPPA
jgi:amidase